MHVILGQPFPNVTIFDNGFQIIWNLVIFSRRAVHYQNAPNPSHTATIAAFLLGFHSKNRVLPTKNGSAIATITVKPERLAHLCVEQVSHGCVSLAGLNLTEAKMSVFLHHLQYNFTR